MPISAASTEVHGIRDEDVVDNPRFREIAEEVEEMLAGADIGGYAVVGDVQIIEREMNIAGRESWAAWPASGTSRWTPLRPYLRSGGRGR